MSVISFEEAQKKLEKVSNSDAELTPNTMSEFLGQLPTDTEEDRDGVLAYEVLAKSHFEGFTTKCDYARDNADVVAMLACAGFITTNIQGDQWSNLWKITVDGLAFLQYSLEGEMDE